MKTPCSRPSGFALVVTLVLMALVVAVVVAYLGNTRTDRSTSSLYANRLRAKMMADSGLTAATKLLYENTKYGNYVTAMPAPAAPGAAPTPIRTELYRPTDPSSASASPDYLRLSNAVGEVLISRVDAAPLPVPTPQFDPRPAPATIPVPPAGDPWGLSPTSTTTNSFDFNQTVRVAGNSSGRLIHPDGAPALAQWVRVRNSLGELVGRYAFFIEDESMKMNVDAAGNNLGSPNLRVNDLAVPAATPASQVQEVDPTALLLAGNRQAANAALAGLGSAGERLPTAATAALLSNWNSTDTYAHLLTALSRDDNTTARGWQRLDLNALVASATDNAAKAAVATRIANWMRDAWTGPTLLSALQYHQMFNDSRLRLQIAANIVDYIDQDNIPTDAGNVIPDGYTDEVPVLGIEKLPYLVAVEVVYEASNSTAPSPAVIGTYKADLRFRLQFRFINLFDAALDPASTIGRIEVKGVPVLTKNGPLTPPFDYESETFTINLGDLKPVNGTGNCDQPGVCSVPAGTDGTSDSGAKSVQSDWLRSSSVSFNVVANDQNPRFQAGKLTVKVFGKNGERLDDTAMVWNGYSTGYQGPNSTKDFLTDATPSTGALKIASINLVAGASYETGDPRHRGRLLDERWRTTNRTDATLPAGNNRLERFVDKAEVNARSFGVDWFDESGNRPLAMIRNGPMLNIGELGQIAATEYPWRTLYLQHPERPPNTSQTGPKDEIPLRRRESVDHVLADLFRAGGSVSRAGALNVNTQQGFFHSGAANATFPLHGLFLGVPVGSAAPTLLTQAAPAAAPSPADRLSTSVNLLVPSMTMAQSSGTGTTPQNYRVASLTNKRVGLAGETATADMTPARPYLAIGEVASTLSRLVSASEASDTSGSSSRSKVVYSILRPNPQSTTTNQNYRRDFHVEQAFRQISNSITTRGNVFRVLYVGQAVTDVDKNGSVTSPNEIRAEYLAEAFLAREGNYAPEPSNADGLKTSDSSYRVLQTRTVIE